MISKNTFQAWIYVLAGVFLLSFSFTGFTQTTDKMTLQYPTAANDLNTAKATVKAYETGNWEDLRNFLDEDARIYGLGNFDSLNVDQTINYWKKGRETANPTLAEESTWLGVSIEEGPQQGNWIFHWGMNTLTYENGEEIDFPYHVAMRIENDKVVESHFYYDNMKIIRGLGYAISPPLEDEKPSDYDDKNDQN